MLLHWSCGPESGDLVGNEDGETHLHTAPGAAYFRHLQCLGLHPDDWDLGLCHYVLRFAKQVAGGGGRGRGAGGTGYTWAPVRDWFRAEMNPPMGGGAST